MPQAAFPTSLQLSFIFPEGLFLDLWLQRRRNTKNESLATSFFFLLFFSHTWQAPCSFCSLHFPQSPPLPPISQIYSSSLKKNKTRQNKETEIAGLPGMSTEHSLASYNRTRHKSSYQGWLSTQPCLRTWVPSTGKRDTPSSTIENSQSTKLHTIRYMQTHTGPMFVALVSVSP